MTKTQSLLHKLGFLQAVASQIAEAIEGEAPMRDNIKIRLDDLDPNDPVRQRAASRDTGEGETYSPISQSFCSGCGVSLAHESNFCPNCGNPSKRLQAAAVEREQPEQPSSAYEMIGPQLKGRLNVADVTAEIYDDQSVVILTPHAVSVTFDRLSPEAMRAFEVRLIAIREKEEVRKAAAAPTSLVTSSKELR